MATRMGRGACEWRYRTTRQRKRVAFIKNRRTWQERSGWRDGCIFQLPA